MMILVANICLFRTIYYMNGERTLHLIWATRLTVLLESALMLTIPTSPSVWHVDSCSSLFRNELPGNRIAEPKGNRLKLSTVGIVGWTLQSVVWKTLYGGICGLHGEVNFDASNRVKQFHENESELLVPLHPSPFLIPIPIPRGTE